MSDITRTKIRSRYADVEIDLFAGFGEIKCGLLNGLAEDSRNFPCDTEDALAVRSVGCDGNIENIIVKAENGLNIASGNAVFGKDKEAVVSCTGEHILSNADLNTRAEHAERIVTSELALADRHEALDSLVILGCCVNLCADKSQRILAARLYIICTAADLKHAVLTCINSAKMKMRAFYGFAGLYFTYNDLADVLAYFVFFLHFESAAEEFFFKHIRSNVNINIIFKPA